MNLEEFSKYTPELRDKIISNKLLRKNLAEKSHYWFFHLYFPQYVKYPTADFQREIFSITEDSTISLAVIIAFRGSSKSTIITMSSAIWSVIGSLQKKHIVIISQTQNQARLHLTNIKKEFESNELSRNDFGSVEEVPDEWGSSALIIPKFNARIVAVSMEQSIRGIRFGEHRPDFIICDDVEDLSSVKTRESREKSYNWFKGDILSLGDENTKVIVVGNLLHEDSLLMRIKKEIESGELTGIIREYPFMDSTGVPLWKSRYPNMESITNLKKRLGDERTWQREYLLKILPDEYQIVKKEWINYWDALPDSKKRFRYTLICVDPAITENTKGDYTAIVILHVFGRQEKLRVYVDSKIINKRMGFPETLELLEQLSVTIGYGRHRAKICIEDVAYQRSISQQLEHHGYKATAVPIHGLDKRTRLSMASTIFSMGRIYFSRKGAEQLIQQVLYLGVEKHDDLCDALTLGLNQVILKDKKDDDCVLTWA